MLKQGHLNQAAQNRVQTAFVDLQLLRLHNTSMQPIPELSHPHCEKVFPSVQTEPPVLCFVPILLFWRELPQAFEAWALPVDSS